MASLLLALIYLAFISLGLPDSLLGAGWPVMYIDLGVPLSFAGIITIIISISTITSSLLSDIMTRKLGTGLLTSVSILLTALSMLAFSFSTEFWQLCILAVPYGLGAGAIDAALNNYVALNFSSRHMSWLHCCWGIGATISPYIMGACLTGNWGWLGGYRVVSLIQLLLAVIMFIALPLWKKSDSDKIFAVPKEKPVHLNIVQTLKLPGTVLMFVAFFSYCAVEQTTMLWASSYLVEHHALDVEKAASFASMFFIGLTMGRGMCGFIADKLGDKRLIRIGTATIFLGIILVAIPVKTYVYAIIGFIIIGLGCAPIYPSIVHATPDNFGRQYSQSIIGVQMSFAYLGITFVPPVFGLIAEYISISLLPLYLFAFWLPMLILIELMNKLVLKNRNLKEKPPLM
ncbi:MAG TPA: MFS transporter [Clostridia bacterium]|nr:MFS transporter [Clostridia bacterium]